jgi:hypothetical protein
MAERRMGDGAPLEQQAPRWAPAERLLYWGEDERMSTIEEVEGWWGVEWDWQGGALGVHPIAEIVKRNGEAMVEGRMESRVLVALVPTLQAGLAVRRLAKRELAERGIRA